LCTMREPRTGRLRASLRGLLPAIITVPMVLLSSRTVPGAVGEFFDPTSSTGMAVNFVAQWVLVYAIPIAVALGLAIWLDRGSLARFGLDVDAEWVVNWGMGVGISLVGVTLWMTYGASRDLFAVHPERLTDFGDATLAVALAAAGLGLVFVFLGNIWEEIVFRGVMLQNFAEGLVDRGFSVGLAVAGAMVASLVFFGAYHVPDRGVFVGLLTVPIGFVFALAYLLTGRLGLAIGVHMGRVPIELLQGADLGAVRLPMVFEVGALSLAQMLESVAVDTVVSCSLILVWILVSKGKIEIAEGVWKASTSSEYPPSSTAGKSRGGLPQGR